MGWWRGGGAGEGLFGCAEQPPSCSAGRRLTVDPCAPLACQVAGASLVEVQLSTGVPDTSGGRGYEREQAVAGRPARRTLRLQGSLRGVPLQSLLDALVPPAQQLQALDLPGLPEVEQQACPGLLQLQALAPGACTNDALASLLQQAPWLADLDLRHCSGGVPPCVVRMQGITRLSLSSCRLQALPPGPYLSGEPLLCR